jgi:hypothetical protein
VVGGEKLCRVPWGVRVQWEGRGWPDLAPPLHPPDPHPRDSSIQQEKKHSAVSRSPVDTRISAVWKVARTTEHLDKVSEPVEGVHVGLRRQGRCAADDMVSRFALHPSCGGDC